MWARSVPATRSPSVRPPEASLTTRASRIAPMIPISWCRVHVVPLTRPPRALPAAPATRSLLARLAGGRVLRRVALVDLRLYRLVRSTARAPRTVAVVRAFSTTGEHAAIWLALGAAGYALDPPRRPRWRRALQAVARGLRAQHRAQGRRQAPSPVAVRPARAGAHAHGAELPERACVVVVRRGPRLLRAAAGAAAVRHRGGDGGVPGLPRRALPDGHRGRRGARDGGREHRRDEGRHRRDAERRQVVAVQRAHQGAAPRRPTTRSPRSSRTSRSCRWRTTA